MILKMRGGLDVGLKKTCADYQKPKSYGGVAARRAVLEQKKVFLFEQKNQGAPARSGILGPGTIVR